MEHWQFWTLLAVSLVNLLFTMGVFRFSSDAYERLCSLARQMRRLLGDVPG